MPGHVLRIDRCCRRHRPPQPDREQWPEPRAGGGPGRQERVLGRRPAVVAATPGRLWDLMSGGAAAGGGGSSGGRAAPHLARLGALDFLVLDEADRMVQQGHFQVPPPPLHTSVTSPCSAAEAQFHNMERSWHTPARLLPVLLRVLLPNDLAEYRQPRPV